MTILNNILLFLIAIIFSFIISVLLLRIILQMLRANFNNPICQFIAQVTNPIILPLRRVLPRVPYIDIASLLLLTVAEFAKFICLGLVHRHAVDPILILLVKVIADLIIQTINIFFYAIIGAVLCSWITPNQRNAVTEILYVLSEPVLRQFRKVVPIISGIDFSPLVALICLEFVAIIILSSLPTM